MRGQWKGWFCTAAAALALGGCASWGPVSPQQRMAAQTDTTERPDHPKGILARSPGDASFNPLRCLNYGEEIVCQRGEP